ncbi:MULTISPECIES: ATP/GTP-binding protein [Comamonas]|uniref:AAA family ATPase n=1 Tax=Comamonas TaxID=283 RepID=UPI0001DA6B9B|nr:MULTISPECIES: ATP-binding protein [Comamonas]EFI63734.1 abortive infection protein [Comamonas thiooxydans]
MFHTLRFSNFFSFADETEVSFILDARSSDTESSFASVATDRRLSKLLAVVGANGAGKTNVIKALDFVAWFVTRSFFIDPSSNFLVKPHAFEPNDATSFELEFEAFGKLYRYALTLNRERVLFESLRLKTSRTFSTLFSREWDEDTGTDLIVMRGFGLPQKQAQKVKPLTSLISLADQYGVDTAQAIVKVLSRRYSNVGPIGRHAFQGTPDVLGAAEFFKESEAYRIRMVELLNAWDFGLKDVQLETLRTVEKGKEEDLLVPFGIHSDGDNEVKLPMFAESSGTQAAFVLLADVLPILAEGGTVIFDELESDLHPLMLEPILNLFISPKTNPHNAQLIFTCHSVEIMNLLKKGQIMLVEKNERCRSEAWRLSDMEGVRADDNFYAKYMAGAYGAVPIL